MVSVVHALPPSDEHAAVVAGTLDLLMAGVPPEGRDLIERALTLASTLYGRSRWTPASRPSNMQSNGIDRRIAESRHRYATGGSRCLPPPKNGRREALARKAQRRIRRGGGSTADGLHVKGLRLLTRPQAGAAADVKAQTETLRKMLLAMVEDIRVVLLRLASRTQTLRYFTDQPGQQREEVAHESLEIYAPLANRLGVWQLKWELEDLSFRFIEPETYQRIARMLDEKRAERELFITSAVERLKTELALSGIAAEVYGRPKHIYSIWSKMRGKDLDFAQVYDVRALRVLVAEVKDCYTVLGLVHHLWQPIRGEFDDYIAHPKGNNYRSLHTAVTADDGNPFEVQIRTHEMHRHAELGVAAHWRY